MLVRSAVSIALQMNTREIRTEFPYNSLHRCSHFGVWRLSPAEQHQLQACGQQSTQPQCHHTDDSAVDSCGLHSKQLAELAELVLIAHTHCLRGGGGSPEPGFIYSL